MPGPGRCREAGASSRSTERATSGRMRHRSRSSRSPSPASACRIVAVARRVSCDCSTERGDDLFVGGEAPGRLLGKCQPAIDANLEYAAGGTAQGHLRSRVGFADQSCRLTGARFIASLAAVFDLDAHDHSPSLGRTSTIARGLIRVLPEDAERPTWRQASAARCLQEPAKSDQAAGSGGLTE